MGTRCMHYGQIEWGQDAFSRTNPIVRGLICMGTQCTNTEDQSPDVSMEYDVCESTSFKGDVDESMQMEIFRGPIEWTNSMGEQGACTKDQSHVDKLHTYVCSSI